MATKSAYQLFLWRWVTWHCGILRFHDIYLKYSSIGLVSVIILFVAWHGNVFNSCVTKHEGSWTVHTAIVLLAVQKLWILIAEWIWPNHLDNWFLLMMYSPSLQHTLVASGININWYQLLTSRIQQTWFYPNIAWVALCKCSEWLRHTKIVILAQFLLQLSYFEQVLKEKYTVQ